MGGGATSRADGQAIDGTGTSDSYEVTGLPGWLPHRTDRQVAAKTPHPKRAGQARTGSGPCWWGPDIINGKDIQLDAADQGNVDGSALCFARAIVSPSTPEGMVVGLTATLPA